MTWRRSDLHVALALTGVLALVALALWATVPALRFKGQRIEFRVAELQGLEAGAAVLVSGYPVGRVRAIEPVAVPGGLDFLVELAVGDAGRGTGLDLREGTWAEITVESLLGSPVVLLHPTSDVEAPPLADGAFVPAVAGGGGINAVVQRIPILLDRVDSVLTTLPGLVVQMERTFANAQVASDTIRLMVSEARQTATQARLQMERMIQGAEESLSTVGVVAERAQGGIDTVLAKTVGTIDSVSVAIEDATRLVRRMGDLALDSEPAVRQLLADLEETAFVLNNLVKSVSARPYRLLTGVEVPEFPARAQTRPDSGG